MSPYPTGRLAALLAASAAAALAVGPAAPLLALAVAAADAALAPRPEEIRFGRSVHGHLRLGRAASAVVRFRWEPRRRTARPRAFWWADGAPASLVTAAPEGTARLTPRRDLRVAYGLRPTRRGEVRWSGPRLALASPLGLWVTRIVADVALRRTVYPGTLPSGALPGEAAAAAAPARGEHGVEFDGVRPYLDGEDARGMHWRATARRDQPVVRRLRPERGRRLVLAIDAGRWSAQALGESPGAPTRLDLYCAAAAQVAAAALDGGDAVGLCLCRSDAPPAVLAPRAGRQALPAISRLLAAARPSPGDVDPAAAAAAVLRLPAEGILWFAEPATPEDVAELGPALARLARRRRLTVCAVAPEPVAGEGTPLAGEAEREYRRWRAAAVRAFARRGVAARDAPAGRLGAVALDAYLRWARSGAAR